MVSHWLIVSFLESYWLMRNQETLNLMLSFTEHSFESVNKMLENEIEKRAV